MAKLYGEIAASALLTLDKSFARALGQPLDSTEVYYSKTAAEEYAATPNAYVGQKIVVVENGVVTHYSIENAEGALKELGSKPVGDEKSITVAENGTVSLKGVGSLTFERDILDEEGQPTGEKEAVQYQPLMTAAGLVWIEPSKTTVEGLATLIDALTIRVKALEDDRVTEEELEAAVKVAKDRADEAYTLAEGKVDSSTYATDKKALEDEDKAVRAIAEAAKSSIDTFLNTEGVADVVDSLKDIKDELDKMADATDLVNGLALKADKTYVDDELAKKQDVIAENTYDTYGAAATAKSEAIADAESKIATAKQEAVDDAATKYATKESLKATDDKAVSNATAIENLTGRIDDIVAEGGEPNQINNIKVNGKVQAIAEDKSVDITVPTKFTDITDDSGFDARITAAQNQADKGVNDASAAQTTANEAKSTADANTTAIGTLNGTVAGHTESIADHATRIGVLEQADITHAAEYKTLSGIVSGHTETIAKKAEQTALDAVSQKASANETAIQTLNETTVPAINTEVAKKANAADVYTKTEVNNITGTPAEGKTLVQMITDAKAEATYDDTAVKALITAEETRAKAAEQANANEIARVNGVLLSAIENKEEGLDSIKELASWIEEHGTEASEMTEAISDNAEAIAAINNETTGILATAKKYTDDSIAGLPTATAEALGLVKFDNTTIKMNENSQLYVAKVSTDILVQGEAELILNGGNASK